MGMATGMKVVVIEKNDNAGCHISACQTSMYLYGRKSFVLVAFLPDCVAIDYDETCDYKEPLSSKPSVGINYKFTGTINKTTSFE